jgi:hypothetical protein
MQRDRNSYLETDNSANFRLLHQRKRTGRGGWNSTN